MSQEAMRETIKVKCPKCGEDHTVVIIIEKVVKEVVKEVPYFPYPYRKPYWEPYPDWTRPWCPNEAIRWEIGDNTTTTDFGNYKITSSSDYIIKGDEQVSYTNN